tara:strand:- start:5145 stop:5300 length:156 start_codon:yes stop_codon:yes gene_type:complete
MKTTKHRIKAGISALAISAALLPFGAYAQTGGPTADQLLALIQGSRSSSTK